VSLLLSDAELVEVTKRDRPKLQARILRRLGIPFVPHPVDGGLLVYRDAVRAILSGREAANQPIPTVDVEAIRRRGSRGQAQKAGR
jgi:hypothetical protein